MKHVRNAALIRQQRGCCALSLPILVKSLHAALSYRKKSLQKKKINVAVLFFSDVLYCTKLGTESSGVGAGLLPEKVSLSGENKQYVTGNTAVCIFFSPHIIHCPNPIRCSLHLEQQEMLAVTGIAK